MEGWVEHRIGSLGEFVGGGTPSTEDHACWNGNILWLVPSDISNNDANYIWETSSKITEKGLATSAAKLLPIETLCMSSRATVGDCVITKVPLATNQGFINIICNEKVDNEFLLHWLRQNKNYILKYAAGTTFGEIGKSTFKKLKINLPPKQEQESIASILNKVDESIAATKKSSAKAERLKKSLLQNLFSGKIKADGSLRKDSEFYKDEKFGNVPIGWVIMKGNKITDKITKGQSPKWQGFEYQTEGTLFVTSENVLEGRIDVSSPKYLPNSFNQKMKGSQLKKGDVLFNIVGASIGRCAVYNLEVENANINQAVCLFRPDENNNSDFLAFYFQSSHTQYRLLGGKVETARANLSLCDFRKFKFVIPESKDEQIEIANRVKQVDNILISKQTKIKKLERLKKALMQNLLTGKVRVKILETVNG